MRLKIPCEKCKGSGVISVPYLAPNIFSNVQCPRCKGEAFVKQKRTAK